MEEIVENVILPNGMRRVRIVGDAPISPLTWACALPDEALPLAELVQGEDKSLGIHSLVMTWPVRDLVIGVQLASGAKIEKPMVVWKLVSGDRMSMAIRYAADMFERSMGRRPGFAWLRFIPELATQYVGDVELMQADWAYPGCVFIGG
jgi:hypothetical protein